MNEDRNIIRIPMQFFAEEETVDDDFDWGDGEEDVPEETGEEESTAPDEPESPEETEEPEEEAPAADGPAEEGQEHQDAPEGSVPVTPSIVQPPAQNYNLAAISMVERMAKQSGMSVEQYVQAVERQSREQRIQQEVERGIPREYAERLMQLEDNDRQRQAQEEVMRQESENRRQYDEFVSAYPEVRELPPQVIQKISAGETPLHAYMAYENAQLKQEIAALKKNDENRKKSFGSVKSRSGADSEKDAFLAAFDEA